MLIKQKKQVRPPTARQVRSDVPDGVKLGEIGFPVLLLVPVIPQLTTAEKAKYVSEDGKWCQCWNTNGGLFFVNPAKPTENWFEIANYQDAPDEPDPDTYEWAPVQIRMAGVIYEAEIKYH